ncbi:MAG TPA: aspartate/glutamate racemase family protein [Burkholderiales bacterium]|jgi:aspartate/glutamate racemase|nr:aspartate/glutamate racemase family protein [Burkholderiales bacterium]
MRIALIHAVRLAMQPVEDAFRRHWPEAERINLLDDALSVDRDRAGALTVELSARISALANYAISAGASGILYTCSAFGEAIDAVKQRVRMPVLKPNEAMFAEAIARGSRLGLLATFPASVNSMARELEVLAPHVELESACVPQALTALQAGAGAQHDALLAAVAPKLGHCDAVMLAQFSTARARDAVASVVKCPVLASPDSAVLAMRKALG